MAREQTELITVASQTRKPRRVTLNQGFCASPGFYIFKGEFTYKAELKHLSLTEEENTSNKVVVKTFF